MKFLKTLSLVLCLLFLGALATGFVLFTLNVVRLSTPSTEKADAIVVLTGVQSRLQEGAQLLQKGLGKRLLISGVNPQIGQSEIRELSGLDAKSFSCCVDLGYTAQNTSGNASETQTWVGANQYHTLIIVTSNYHMPRSLAELKLLMPDIRLIPHPVRSGQTNLFNLWFNPFKLRNLLTEYIKFLPSALRLGYRSFTSPKKEYLSPILE